MKVRKAMSALPPKADMCSALAYVCFGPKADIGSLLNQLVSALLKLNWHVEAERLSGFKINH
jgi:hypothetical protein